MPSKKSPQKTVKKPRKLCKYSSAERGVIEPFKHEYRSGTNKDERTKIFRTRICTAMVAYWQSKGEVVQHSRGVELSGWVANNWRPYCTAKASKSTHRVNYLDVVYQKYKQEVLNELKIMLNIEDVSIHKSEVFPYRSKAAKIVFERFGEDKKADIMQLVETYKREGNNEKTRRYIARRNARSNIAEWHDDAWLKMGMFAVTFYGYIRDDDDKYVVNVYDNMAKQAGLNESKFVSRHKGVVRTLLVGFGDHIKELKRQYDQLKDAATAQVPTQGTPANEDMPEGPQLPALPVPAPDIAGSQVLPALQLTAQGFPILPPINFESRSKEDLEGLLRDYVGRHYKLASAGFSDRVPFTTVKQEMPAFVSDDHIPPGFILTDPHNMKKNDIVAFFKHVINRQNLYNPEHAFRFRAFRRKGDVHCAMYPSMPVECTPLEDAGLPVEAPATMPHSGSMIQIHQHEMMTLIERGLHPVLPVNGPNDSPNGQPIYVVPAQAQALLNQDAVPLPELRRSTRQRK
ncbi:hypothetical protein F5887DRAFT_920431 [Amanita rubescens]|nr:hypothetical protein F5887DRAFT_920431 [Amanita rubescens]